MSTHKLYAATVPIEIVVSAENERDADRLVGKYLRDALANLEEIGELGYDLTVLRHAGDLSCREWLGGIPYSDHGEGRTCGQILPPAPERSPGKAPQAPKAISIPSIEHKQRGTE